MFLSHCSLNLREVLFANESKMCLAPNDLNWFSFNSIESNVFVSLIRVQIWCTPSNLIRLLFINKYRKFLSQNMFELIF